MQVLDNASLSASSMSWRLSIHQVAHCGLFDRTADCTLQFVVHCSLPASQIIAAMHAYPTRPRTAWVREWPAMVVLAVSQIFWARGVEEAVMQGNTQVSGWLSCR